MLVFPEALAKSLIRAARMSSAPGLLDVVVACPPRISDAAAAIRQATIANANASCRPLRNGAEIRCGKNVRPVSVAWLAADSEASTWGPEQVLDRVVAEEGGEQDRYRRQLPDAMRRGVGDAVRL